jgi:hypothetical protein
MVGTWGLTLERKANSKDYAAVFSFVTHYPRQIKHYLDLLKKIPGIVHTTIEVNVCQDEPCLPVDSGVLEG